MPKGYKLNIQGERYGRLVVLAREGKKHGQSQWKCLCDCGNFCLVTGTHLRHKTHPTKSCGCLAIERTKETKTTHGKTGTPEFTAWVNMMDRCYNPHRESFPHYGGRGIKVADCWHGPDGVIRFMKDMGPRPSPKHSLERVNVNGNYEPINCVWGDAKTQSRNRRKFCSLSGFTTEELQKELERRSES